MTELYEHTFEGKLLQQHLKMLRDMDSGRIELRYWKFELPFGDCLCLLGRRLDRICHVVAQKASGDFNVWNLKAQA